MQTVDVQDEDLRVIADLLRERNAIDARISAVIGRPITAGHLGEWIAARIFGIDLEPSATAAAVDERFSTGALQGRTVNVKWYLKRDGLLDVTESDALDYYLVLTGPEAPPTHSRGSIRPRTLEAVYLFDARQLREQLRSRGVKIGVASSLLTAQWAAAEIFPQQGNRTLIVQPGQAVLLRQFALER